MRKSMIASVLVALLSMVSITGCGGSGNESTESIVLKAGFSTGASDPRVIATELFKEEVEAETGGRITVEIHTDGELGSDSDLIGGVVNGEIDMTCSSAGNFASYDPNVGLSAFPFLFDDFEQAWQFVDSENEALAEAGLSDYNVKVLAHFDNGFRCVTTSADAGPVESVDDMNGLIIRTPENQIVMQTMLLLGADPRVLGFAEVYDALKKGEFDAQENPIPVIYNNNLYEVQSNLAITNHSYDVMLFVIRQDIWDTLSTNDQNIIMKAASKAQEKDRELIKSQTEDYILQLEEKGMNVTYPDLKEFKEATKSIVDDFSDQYDPELLEKIR